MSGHGIKQTTTKGGGNQVAANNTKEEATGTARKQHPQGIACCAQQPNRGRLCACGICTCQCIIQRLCQVHVPRHTLCIHTNMHHPCDTLTQTTYSLSWCPHSVITEAACDVACWLVSICTPPSSTTDSHHGNSRGRMCALSIHHSPYGQAAAQA